MMHITRKDLESMDRIRRLNLVNSITGFKPANLIGTRSESGITNLAIVSSVLHLSSSPAMIGFMQRPTTVPRHTYRNIRETGVLTINHVSADISGKAHYTSAKFPEEISEFSESGLGEEYLGGFYAPFVKESLLKMAVTYQEEYHVKASNTILVVGKIESVYLPEEIISGDGQPDLESIGSVAISGLNHYHTTKKFASYPYARPGKFPVNTIPG